MLHSGVLCVKQSQIKAYKNLTRVFDVSNYSLKDSLNLLKGCYLVCISRGSNGVNGFYAVDQVSKKHVVCLGQRAATILNDYSIPELIDIY